MAIIFETIQTEGLAELSYLVGDDSEKVAAVFDPRADVDCYLELAREKGLSITHVFETHVHADLVSGSRELQSRLGGSAKIHASGEGGARYGFEMRPVRDGDVFSLGSVVVTARHTPGHTPEHLAYLLAEKPHPDTPWGVLTGDSLFVASAGRPDLLGEDHTQELAEEQFHTLRDFFLKLPDGTTIHPAHGHGSPCGADIGDRLFSTIGYERRFNPYLQIGDPKEFARYALSSAPPVPTYYPRMKKVNAEGPEILGGLPAVSGLPPRAFEAALQNGGSILVDTRSMLAFGGSHIEGATNIGASPMLSIWAGWLLDTEKPILLVLDSDEKLAEVLRLFVRTGYNRFAGYLVGGMEAWDNAGLPLKTMSPVSVAELNDSGPSFQIIDVRSPGEWKGGHVPGAHHLFLPEVRRKAKQFDPAKPTAVYCASGYRASIAASILQQEGFTDVHGVPGSWQAWKKSGYPVASEVKA